MMRGGMPCRRAPLRRRCRVVSVSVSVSVIMSACPRGVHVVTYAYGQYEDTHEPTATWPWPCSYMILKNEGIARG
eukprot:5100805-Prymnesium_polylepis.2